MPESVGGRTVLCWGQGPLKSKVAAAAVLVPPLVAWPWSGPNPSLGLCLQLEMEGLDYHLTKSFLMFIDYNQCLWPRSQRGLKLSTKGHLREAGRGHRAGLGPLYLLMGGPAPGSLREAKKWWVTCRASERVNGRAQTGYKPSHQTPKHPCPWHGGVCLQVVVEAENVVFILHSGQKATFGSDLS